ncbi:MAG: ArsR/SmtB family transcription factor [Candidatus Hodarchaeales archaeon]
MSQHNQNEEITDILPLINHPIRVDIIKLIHSEPQSFTDLLRHLSIESTSKLSFHLNKLDKLLSKNENNEYQLNDLGKKTYNLILAFEEEKLIEYKQKKDKDSKIISLSFNWFQEDLGTIIVTKLRNLNPAIFTVISALILTVLVHLLFTNFKNGYEYTRNFDLFYILMWFFEYYLPATVFVIYVRYKKLSRKFSLYGLSTTLMISFFLSKISIFETRTFEGIPWEQMSDFLWVGVNLFHNKISSLNVVFIITLALFSLLFPLYMIIILRITRKEKIVANNEPRLQIPNWLKLLSNKSLLFIFALVYTLLLFVLSEKKTGIEITYTWNDAVWGLTTSVIEIKHFIIPPLGYSTPALVFLVPIALLVYIILGIETHHKILKNLSVLSCIISIPAIHLYEVVRYVSQTQNLEKFFASLSSLTPLELSISGVQEYLIMELVHISISVIVIGITISLLLKFFVRGQTVQQGYSVEIK